MRDFIDGRVIAVEPTLDRGDEESARALGELKDEAKALGLWALGHPEEIGGGGLDLVSFVLLNEIIGRSEWGQFAVGSLSMQDAIMLYRFGSPE
jgi:alkylation response protein AidB-like acyl-CoA dehydrogenase